MDTRRMEAPLWRLHDVMYKEEMISHVRIEPCN